MLGRVKTGRVSPRIEGYREKQLLIADIEPPREMPEDRRDALLDPRPRRRTSWPGELAPATDAETAARKRTDAFSEHFVGMASRCPAPLSRPRLWLSCGRAPADHAATT